MTITDEQLDEKRRRNAEAEAELRRIENERIEREAGAARQQTADHLDAEYERIQALVAQAKALSDAGDDPEKISEAVTTAAPATAAAVPATPKRGDNKSSDGKDADAASGEGK